MYDKLILFDGICNLCSAAVQFVLRHEKTPDIHFVALQSEKGKRILSEKNIDPVATDSIVFIENDEVFIKSDAALKIAGHLKFPYRWLPFFSFIPKSIRDYFYDLIARHRYKILGRKTECWVPTGKWKRRFL